MSGKSDQAPGEEFLYEIAVSTASAAPAETVYEVISELSTHLEWNGTRRPEKTRLLTLDAPAGPASVGTEFTSTGKERSARFEDRSVVTQADPPSVFEFVTESTRTPKRGRPIVQMTNVNRYEITPNGSGCRVTYRIRVVRLTNMPALLRFAPLRKVALAEGKRQTKSAVEELVRVAEERPKGGSR